MANKALLKHAVQTSIREINGDMFSYAGISGYAVLSRPITHLTDKGYKINNIKKGMKFWIVYNKNNDIISEADMKDFLKD